MDQSLDPNTSEDIQKPETNTSVESAERASLADSLDQLYVRFEKELSGAGQATRSHLVRFLAYTLEVAIDTADRILVRLQNIGAIERTVDQRSGKYADQWKVHDSSSFKSELEEIEQDELGSSPIAATSEFVAAEDLLRRAIHARATDIHLDPFDDEVEVRFRIDGQLNHFCRMSEHVASKTISQLKLMGSLDIAEPFEPQEGRIKMPPSMGEHAARLTVVPVSGGESVVVRLLHRDRLIRPLSTLGFSPEQREIVDRLIAAREGIVLVTGPTSSGKTTTLYSFLHELNDGHTNIVTIEDPIELRIPSYVQIEVDRKHELTSTPAFKTVLRMDPDVVMLGEIRDDEVAATALRAADTGTYVLSTVHARDAASVLTVLRDLHIDERALATTLRAVVSQRLVRKLCDHCKSTRTPNDDEQEVFAKEEVDLPNELACRVGCERCKQTGYFDRIGIFEVVEVTPTIASAIQQKATEDELRHLLREGGVASLATDALRKVAAGVTDLDELKRIAWLTPVQIKQLEVRHESDEGAQETFGKN